MMKHRLMVLPLLLALTFPLAACSSTFNGDSSSAGLSQGAPAYSRDTSGGGAKSVNGVAEAGDAVAPQQKQVPSETKYVIKTANMSIKVEDVEKKLTEARKVITSHEGEIGYSTSRIKDRETTASAISESPDYSGRTMPNYYPDYVVGDYAIVSFKIPADKLEASLDDLRKLGEVVVDTISSQEVTLEVLGLDAQIASTSKSLEGLEKLLLNAKNVDETLRVEQAITQRRGELASLQAQQNSLKQQAAKSSVTLQLVTDKAVKLSSEEQNWFQKTWEKISSASSDVIAILVLLLLFFTPLVALVIGLIKLLKKLFKKNHGIATGSTKKKEAPVEVVASSESIEEDATPKE